MFTIICEGNSLITEKKSKFIGKAFPVQNEEDALSKINEIKKIHYDAAHNVFAYRIGERSEISRYSDDGEPNGTAGLPVLNALNGGNIQYTLIIVTRYFGGTLLGTGGLVRCYGKAATEALTNAGVVEKVLCHTINVDIPYNFLGKIQYCAAQSKYRLQDTIYTDNVRLTFHIEDGRTDTFIKDISEITNGEALPEILAPLYVVKNADIEF